MSDTQLQLAAVLILGYGAYILMGTKKAAYDLKHRGHDKVVNQDPLVQMRAREKEMAMRTGSHAQYNARWNQPPHGTVGHPEENLRY